MRPSNIGTPRLRSTAGSYAASCAPRNCFEGRSAWALRKVPAKAPDRARAALGPLLEWRAQPACAQRAHEGLRRVQSAQSGHPAQGRLQCACGALTQSSGALCGQGGAAARAGAAGCTTARLRTAAPALHTLERRWPMVMVRAAAGATSPAALTNTLCARKDCTCS